MMAAEHWCFSFLARQIPQSAFQATAGRLCTGGSDARCWGAALSQRGTRIVVRITVRIVFQTHGSGGRENKLRLVLPRAGAGVQVRGGFAVGIGLDLVWCCEAR